MNLKRIFYFIQLFILVSVFFSCKSEKTELIWRLKVPNYLALYSRDDKTFVYGDFLITSLRTREIYSDDANYRILIIDKENGRIQKEFIAFSEIFHINNNNLYFFSKDNKQTFLHSYNLKKGVMIADILLSETFSDKAVCFNDTYCILFNILDEVKNTNKALALDLFSQKKIWEKEYKYYWDELSPKKYKSEIIFMKSTGDLFTINCKTGDSKKLLHTFNMPNFTVYNNNLVLLYSLKKTGILELYDLNKDSILWSTEPSFSSLTFGFKGEYGPFVNDNHILVNDREKLVSINLENGDEVYDIKLKKKERYASPIRLYNINNKIYYCIKFRNYINTYDLKTGKLLKKVITSQNIYNVIFFDGKILYYMTDKFELIAESLS